MGVLEQQQEQLENLTTMVRGIQRAVQELTAPAGMERETKWVKRDTLMERYTLSRNTAQRLIDDGVRAGVVKVRTFRARGEKPMQRVEATSFDDYLRSGGCPLT